MGLCTRLAADGTWKCIGTSLLYAGMLYDSRLPGRPILVVSIEEIEYLRGLRFTWTRIAEIIGISRSTLYRRLEEEGVDLTQTYSNISNRELDGVMDSIKQSHPNDGERLVIGHLRRLGIVLPRSRVRASIHRVDPINTAIRRSVAIRRRVYYVEGPNSVWHLDSHHKLIRWRFVVHGGIDGYSRTVTYLSCSTNNKASTVMVSFIDAVDKYGVPDQVRTDLGGENTRVWQYMVEQHHVERAVLVGSSTHNERIERLWRDVYRCVGVLFADLFREMEEDGRLSCLNEVDLYCLHAVFLPRINDALDSFMECWNNHPLSTANNLTPNQMYIQGALRQNMALRRPIATQSTTVQVPTPHNPVAVPRSTFIPCDQLQSELDEVDMLRVTDDFGYAVYKRVCRLVGHHLQQCNDCS